MKTTESACTSPTRLVQSAKPLQPVRRPTGKPRPNKLVPQRTDHFLHNRIRLVTHLIISRILNRMFHEYASRIFHPEGLRLSFCCIFELDRGNRNRRCSVNLKPYRVMQTARGTGASVGQRLDDKIVVAKYFLSQRIRCWFGKRRFHIPSHSDAGTTLGK